MPDEIPDPIANFDQALRACVDVARLLVAYRDALVAQGFTRSEALALTVAYQQQLLGGAQRDSG